MTDAHDAVDSVVQEVRRLRSAITRKRTAQVRSEEERGLMKATALSWFRGHRPTVMSTVDTELVAPVDQLFRELLGGSDRAMRRGACGDLLRALDHALSKLRRDAVAPAGDVARTVDDPPSFAPLIGDQTMQLILGRRWRECTACIAANAPLAATVMMGGLVEALLLARVNSAADKKPVFTAIAAPKDKASGKSLPLQEWTLRHYIDVAHELEWISQSAKDVGVVLRDYRNYVHPYKELSHAVSLQPRDATLFWEVTKSISRQLLGVA
jgi:hypothetical protein